MQRYYVDFLDKVWYIFVMYMMTEETKNMLQKAIAYGSAAPKFSAENDWRKTSRGNPLLAKNRFRTIEEVDAKLVSRLGIK